MSKYIDMEVLSDIRAERIRQAEVRFGQNVRFSPAFDGVEPSTAGIRYNGETGNWEHGNGRSWAGLASSKVSGEIISFSGTDLRNGILTIVHNLGTYILGLTCSHMPKGIDFREGTLLLDYSDRQLEDLSGRVWFTGSRASMLQQRSEG